MSYSNRGGFLRGDEFLHQGKWRQFQLTIKEYFDPGTQHASDGEVIRFGVLGFEKTEKRMIVKEVNRRLMQYATGTDKPAEWIGKTVTVYPVMGDWFGVEGAVSFRIRVPKGKPQPLIKPQMMGKDITGLKQ